jgi:SAM-dependent methyltransferase
MLGGMPDTYFDGWIAERYEALWPELFEPGVVEPAVRFLAELAAPTGGPGTRGTSAELAGTGPALEFGIGTGRIALPLRRRGVRVHGIELSDAMVARLRAQPGGSDVGVTTGDFASVTVGDAFRVVYLVRNTITNLTSQDEQVAAFRNAAAQLAPGGCFVIENYVPALQRLPPGETVHVFAASPEHLGFEDYDVAAQIAISHHYWVIDGQLKTFSSPHRYVWPSELDLMARLAGMSLRERWGDWNRAPFTGRSRSHVSVWEKPASAE